MRFPRLLLPFVVFVLALDVNSNAERIGIYQHGTIVRMRMGECLGDGGIIAALAGNSRPQANEPCPEYTLVAEKVVYVIVGRPSKDVLPLAEEVDFRLRKNEIAVRIDDATREIRFVVREMMLRSDWDRMPQKEAIIPHRYELPVLRDQ